MLAAYVIMTFKSNVSTYMMKLLEAISYSRSSGTFDCENEDSKAPKGSNSYTMINET